MRPKATLGFLVAAALSVGSLPAAEFLRGDANSDGKMTISDAQRVSAFLFRGQAPSSCIKAMNANADPKIDIADAIWVLNYIYRNGPAPAAPFPEPGPEDPDGGGASLPCESYIPEPPIEDPAAKLEILDVVSPGGEDGTAVLTIVVSGTRTLAGYAAEVTFGGEVVGDAEQQGTDLSGSTDGESYSTFNEVTMQGGTLTVGFLSTIAMPADPIPAGTDIQVLEIGVCLRDGTAAGEYPVTVTSAELVDYDTSRAIVPALGTATLTVLEDLAPGAGCAGVDCGQPRPCPIPVDQLTARFSIKGATGRPGADVTLPFSMYADAAVQGYAFSVDFDEEILEAVSIEPLFEKRDGTDYEFSVYEVNNANENSGSDGVDEGFLIGVAVFSFRNYCSTMPARKDVPAVAFHMRVRPETEVTTTELRFLDGGQGKGDPVNNFLVACGQSLEPEMIGNFVFVNGLVDVLPEIIVFIRADTNGDKLVDLSDAVATLDYLFLGSTAPNCYDAADSNDDGKLDITDPIYTLGHLFLGGPAFPPPYPEEGTDPTDDRLRCSAIEAE